MSIFEEYGTFHADSKAFDQIAQVAQSLSWMD